MTSPSAPASASHQAVVVIALAVACLMAAFAAFALIRGTDRVHSACPSTFTSAEVSSSLAAGCGPSVG